MTEHKDLEGADLHSFGDYVRFSRIFTPLALGRSLLYLLPVCGCCLQHNSPYVTLLQSSNRTLIILDERFNLYQYDCILPN